MKYKSIYFGRKLLALILSVFLLSAAVFFISRLAPGDPLVSYYGERAEKMSIEERAAAEERLGLNAPIYVQYIRWLQNIMHGSFGISFKYKTDAMSVICARIPNTLLLGGISFALIFILSLAVGMLCVWNENKLPDRLICKLGTAVSCIPEFWLSLALIFIFSISLKWLPSGGAYPIGSGGSITDRITYLILPVTAAVMSHLWYYAYMVRNRLAQEVRAEYVLLTRAKGLDKKSILFKHCLRNIMPSYLSIMAVSVPHMIGGMYIIEAVFSYPGIGTLSYESARYKDYDLLMLICLITGTAVILCNIIAQMISECIDPRMIERTDMSAAEVQKNG